MDIQNLPIIGICGFSGSGKTTLIEKVVLRLQDRGLRIVVIKHSSKSLTIDQPGKDSDRFYQAGADVFVEDLNGTFLRRHADGHSLIPHIAVDISRQYDLVLVEGYKYSPITKIWLLKDGESEPPDQAGNVISVLNRDQDRVGPAVQLIDDYLNKQWLKPPVTACILIGGKSSRMGVPKHLLTTDNVTWLERTIQTVTQIADHVIISGQGEIPDNKLLRLPDIEDGVGPLAGILSAMRWNLWSTVLVCACDMPELSIEALEWLLGQRKPGVWAVLPQIEDKHYEPLLALYDFRAHSLLEQQVVQGKMRPSDIHVHEKVLVVKPPQSLHRAWCNVNTPDQIHGN